MENFYEASVGRFNSATSEMLFFYAYTDTTSTANEWANPFPYRETNKVWEGSTIGLAKAAGQMVALHYHVLSPFVFMICTYSIFTTQHKG